MKTKDIAVEISQFNRKMEVLARDYILIGPVAGVRAIPLQAFP
jgi:hypothetical protein